MEIPTINHLEGSRYIIQRGDMTGNSWPVLLEYIGCQKYLNYFHYQNRLLRSTLNSTNYKAVGDGLRGTRLSFRLWEVKHVSRFYVTGGIMKTMGSWENSQYPCYKSEQEKYISPATLSTHGNIGYFQQRGGNFKEENRAPGHITRNPFITYILHQEEGDIQICQLI